MQRQAEKKRFKVALGKKNKLSKGYKYNRGVVRGTGKIKMSKYFGTDGFRGEAEITLTANRAYRMGC